MSFDEDQFCSLEEKVNIEDLVLPNDPTTSDENEALDQKIEIKEEIQETFQADPDFSCNFDVTPCVIQKESEENLPKDFLNVRKAPTKICCKEINKDNSNISTVHEEKSTYECQSCNASFFHKGDLNKHISAVHKGKRPYKCHDCDASFAQIGHLNKHISAVHEGKRPYDCQICDASFYEKSRLNRHISTVHEEKRHYNCPHFDSNFSQKDNLKKLISVAHEGKRPYKCHNCDASFFLKASLNRHISAVHERKITHIPHFQ